MVSTTTVTSRSVSPTHRAAWRTRVQSPPPRQVAADSAASGSLCSPHFPSLAGGTDVGSAVRDVWGNREISSPSGVSAVSYPSDRVYLIGVRGNRWTLEALEWSGGRSAFHSQISGQRFNPFFSATEIDETGRIH